MILPTGKHISTVEESVTLDNGGFTALELNSRHLNAKSSFLKKNGTRWGFFWTAVNNISDYGQIKVTITVLYRETDNMHQLKITLTPVALKSFQKWFWRLKLALRKVKLIFVLSNSITFIYWWHLSWKLVDFITTYFTFPL